MSLPQPLPLLPESPHSLPGGRPRAHLTDSEVCGYSLRFLCTGQTITLKAQGTPFCTHSQLCNDLVLFNLNNRGAAGKPGHPQLLPGRKAPATCNCTFSSHFLQLPKDCSLVTS